MKTQKDRLRMICIICDVITIVCNIIILRKHLTEE